MGTLANAIKETLTENIMRWRGEGEMKLPSERDLSEQHSTTRVTIREALKLLETEGLIYRENRRGWFISPPKLRYDPSVHGRVSFVDYARQQGFQPSTQLLSIKLTVADRYIASEMQIAVGKPVYQVNRLRSLNGRPVLYEQMLLRADLLPNLDRFDLEGSLHALLRSEYGMTVQKADFEISVSILPNDVAQALSAPMGVSSLKFQRKYRNQHGEIFEFDHELWRHDAISINFDINN